MAESQLDLLMKTYNVDCTQVVTDSHLHELSYYPIQWKGLIEHLQMNPTVIRKVTCKPGDDRDKRLLFFKEWKLQKGDEATYREIISALLKTRCWNEAEEVCKLLSSAQESSLIPDSPTIMPTAGKCGC